MPELYTDADVQAARSALIEHCVDAANQADPEGAIRTFAESLYAEPDPTVRLVLDAVAPAIAARAFAAGYAEGVAWDGWVPTDEEASAAAQAWIEGKS